jgi:hypothetical protein
VTYGVPIFADSSARDSDHFRAAKREWSERLLTPASNRTVRALRLEISPQPDRNVVGVGIGEKIADDKPTGVQAVRFLVRIKYPGSELLAENLLPGTIDGLPTDVEEVGLFRRLLTAAAPPNPRTKIRPAQPGCSVGFQDPQNQFVMAGTFGALVKDGGSLYVLSNNHVLADEGQLPPGSPIYQPGLLDGGNPATDQIADLTRFVPLQQGVFNDIDAALAQVSDPALVSDAILGIGPPQGPAAAQIDMIVHKFGRTTNYTVGRVTSVDTDVTVGYDTGNFMFQNQMIIVGMDGQPFSNAGDSGSMILERRSGQAVGLLFAGSATHTIANHIDAVLNTLGVSLS